MAEIPFFAVSVSGVLQIPVFQGVMIEVRNPHFSGTQFVFFLFSAVEKSKRQNNNFERTKLCS
jgi:hypothetical protein